MRGRLLYPALLLLTATATVLVFRPSPAPPPEPAPQPSAMTTEIATAEPAASQATTAPSAGPSSGPPERRPPIYVEVNPQTEETCPSGMLLVDGIYCPYVAHRCTRHLIEERDVCQSYAPEVMCEGALLHLRFCIDRYEYPNLRGVKPAVMADFNEAERACQIEGKRLCDAREWTFACEGTQMWPYPYGLERSSKTCNIDKEYRMPKLEAFDHPFEVGAEVERLDQRVASGSLPNCVSPFGVYDMTGNVDEWVVNHEGAKDAPPYRSGLKGGYFGPIRARCRPSTTSHNEWFRFYQVGFRCCSDVEGEPSGEPAGKGKGGWKPLDTP